MPSAQRPRTTPDEQLIAASTWVVVATGLLVLVQMYVGIPLASAIDAGLEGGHASAALTTAFSLGYAIGFLVFGALSDQVGRRQVLIYGLVALAVTTVAVGAASTTGQLACMRALQGLAAATFPAVAIAYLGETLTGRARATAIGGLSTAFLVAAIAGQIYASAFAGPTTWRWAFWSAAPLFVASAAAMAWTMREPDAGHRPVMRLGERFATLGRLIRRPELTRLYGAGFGLLFVFVAFYASLDQALEGAHGLDSADLLLVRLAGLPGMVIGPMITRLRHASDPANVAAAGLGLAAVALVGFALTSTGPPWLPVCVSAIFVLGVAVAVPALIAAVGQRAPDARGAAASLYSAIAFLGASLAPVVVDSTTASTALALALAAILAAASAIVRVSHDRAPGRLPKSGDCCEAGARS